ncbi:hypothetical protein AX17_004725 [Amanita inopinata Kibby_2008]|nr:hypothetical protein AX17_004725 [Amanita inopinata Kibby_2008]
MLYSAVLFSGKLTRNIVTSGGCYISMGPMSDVIVSTLGDSILVELGLHTGFEVSTKLANDLVIGKPLDKMLPIYSTRLETTGVKVLLITLKYLHTTEDAALGFFRSSLHKDNSLFASVKDYLSVEKGWFSPYLFASGRRPVIPRSMRPDVAFCHGPFLSGDYRIGETLLAESASVITFCKEFLRAVTRETEEHGHFGSLSIPSLSNFFSRSRTPSPEPALTPLPRPPTPRRLVMLVVGLKPHRKLWSTMMPAKLGAPLVAWDTLTLEKLWDVQLPTEAEMNRRDFKGAFMGIVDVLFEYLDLCVDWDRYVDPSEQGPNDGGGEGEKKGLGNPKDVLKDAVVLLVAAAIRSGNSKEARKELDKERSGIAMWRIP